MGAFRSLPSVGVLVQRLDRHPGVGGVSAERRVRAARAVLAGARARIAAGESAPEFDTLLAEVASVLAAEEMRHQRRLINASGVLLQTNFGRAPIPAAALAAIGDLAGGYSNLEFDLERGERGSRQAGISKLIAAVTGAAAGIVVNNNAGAVLLALAALVAGRDVLVSRGQLVEIGGGFRIPDVLAQSGARLVEVGTTNRTYAHDYAAAMTPASGAILRVHTSNFVQRGFVHQPATEELAALARARGLLLIDDVGSGALLDTSAAGLAHEPMVQESLAAGADLVCFSGDKLVGGPQAGLVAGKADPVAALSRHPLSRALRIDKLSLVALEATLQHYLRAEAQTHIPVWQMLLRTAAELESQAKSWADQLGAAGLPVQVIAGESTVGGGSLPGETLPTSLISLSPSNVDGFAQRLRQGRPAVIGRVQRGAYLIDPRTVLPDDEATLLASVQAAWHSSDNWA